MFHASRFTLHASRFAVLMAVAALIVATGATPAQANDVSPYMCGNDIEYPITSSVDIRIPAMGTTYKDGPGGVMTVSVQNSSTITMGVSATVSVSVAALFASAQASVSASLQQAVNVTVGHTYSHNIAANKFGNMQYVSYAKKVAFKKTQLQGNCTVKTLGTGTATIPTTSLGWYYWETSS